MWSLSASLAIALLYFAICFFIVRGLLDSGQLLRNQLGLATALIFFSCGAGHLLHAEHVLLGDSKFRAATEVHMTLWDASTAVIALWYVSMRRRYGQLLLGPVMFEDHARIEAEAAARHAATHDHLTELPNRQALFDAIDEALDDEQTSDQCALLFFDLDGFKAVNDRFGHVAGDELLVAVAERLRASVRPNDILGRLGGDEFVILVAGPTTERSAEAVAQRNIAALSEPFMIEGEPVTLSASAGVALAEPGKLHAAELLHLADVAMYQAKAAGRGRCQVHAGATR